MRKLDFKIKKATDLRLDRFLQERLSQYTRQDLSLSEIKTLVDSGHVFLNKKRCRICSKPLIKGATVSLFWGKLSSDLEDLDPLIAYEDRDVIVLNKPPGVPSQSTLNRTEDNLYEALIFHLTQRQPEVLAYAGLIHRLDKGTSGLIAFSKSKRINGSLSSQFQNHKIKKVYLAIVESDSRPNEKWTSEAPLKRVKTAKGYKTESHPQGQEAMTHFKLLKELTEKRWLIEAQPLTGRTHQIRCHLSEAGQPIEGDRLYNSSSPKKHGLMKLHAHKLSFHNPYLKKDVTVEAPVWTDFTDKVEK
tara:strand:+ start:125135 stop:126043 length:909 start_codon:yes stop_codon:yes gene_type:complete